MNHYRQGIITMINNQTRQTSNPDLTRSQIRQSLQSAKGICHALITTVFPERKTLYRINQSNVPESIHQLCDLTHCLAQLIQKTLQLLNNKEPLINQDLIQLSQELMLYMQKQYQNSLFMQQASQLIQKVQGWINENRQQDTFLDSCFTQLAAICELMIVHIMTEKEPNKKILDTTALFGPGKVLQDDLIGVLADFIDDAIKWFENQRLNEAFQVLYDQYAVH